MIKDRRRFLVGGCVGQYCYINRKGETICIPYGTTMEEVYSKTATPLSEVAVLHTK